MSTVSFKAVSLCNEINLNKVGEHFGLKKKFEWEDFVRLSAGQLKGILKEPETKTIMLFAFGSIVFVNMLHHEIVDAIRYLSTIEPRLENTNFDFQDDYTLLFDESSDQIPNIESYTNESLTVKSFAFYQMEIVSMVLAKSVALEKIESDIETLLDVIETVMERLQRGNLTFKDRNTAKISARILGFKYNTLSSIMILDKPDITWNNSSAEMLYQNLAHLFELEERYNKVQQKSNTLMDIVQVFSSLTQHRKSNFLEWIIIVLILFEIIMTLLKYAYKFFF